MDTGKVLDVEPMSRYCKGCTIMEKTRISNPDNYMKWKASHKCNFNYKGSAGGLLSLKKRVSGLGGRGKLTKTIIDQLQMNKCSKHVVPHYFMLPHQKTATTTQLIVLRVKTVGVCI